MPSPLSMARCASLATALAFALPSMAHAGGALDAYLPKSGKIEGHIMHLGVAPEDAAIDRQFRVAVQNNMDWFKKYTMGQKSGQPLPYDPRMGITKAQYETLQHMKADFQPGEPVEVTVTRGADGNVTFASKTPAAKALDKVSFAADEKAAETPYGKLGIFNVIRQDNERAPIGVWTGGEWARVQGEDDKMPSAKIAFGKRSPSGEGVMYYQVASSAEAREQSLVIFYKLD